MNDPRVDGTVTFPFSADAYDSAASEWGAMTVENKDGSWEGPCTGAAWAVGDGFAWSCWLTGSGAYDGYTYYKQSTKESTEQFAGSSGSSTRASPPRIGDAHRMIAAAQRHATAPEGAPPGPFRCFG